MMWQTMTPDQLELALTEHGEPQHWAAILVRQRFTPAGCQLIDDVLSETP